MSQDVPAAEMLTAVRSASGGCRENTTHTHQDEEKRTEVCEEAENASTTSSSGRNLILWSLHAD